MAGQQWYKTKCFWKGGVFEPATLQTESIRAAYQIIIYGELFASTVQAYLEPKKNIPKFDLDVRLDYIKCCIPHWACRSYSGLEVLNVGLYVCVPRSDLSGDQKALRHITHCRRWSWLFEKVKQKLWFEAVQMQGLEGMMVLGEPGFKERREHLVMLRYLVEKLDNGDESLKHIIGTRLRAPVSYAPDFSTRCIVVSIGEDDNLEIVQC
ncbi:hypothetical protein GGU10DRAFT_346760 [Lentinula aff. detonsa]|uniref:Uncharacterized protein n=1 Tax=Lentinula aff. detonsa TaxID=2804958 RepID=A0AA38KXW1_9AGAR|nr:hypothetical protein GGU10DRAFT_346760 [Lentinula aff. detonsa]